jgi:hypothetical protein
MMKKKMIRLVVVAAYIAMAITMGQTATAADIPLMTKEDLKAKLGTPHLVIVDLRVGTDWKASVEIHRTLNPGQKSILKIPHLYSIAPDQTKAPVPVWHRNF